MAKVVKGLVSIIVPTKNEAVNLSILLPSIVKQTYKNIEVIINDDQRTSDSTDQIINKFKSRVKLIHIHKNHGISYGRLMGAKESSGEYLFHLDADMKLNPDVVESCVKTVQDGYDAVVIPEVSYGDGFWSKVKAFEKSLYVDDEMMSSARFIKSKVYWDVGGHNADMVLSEDKDLHLRLKAKKCKIKHVNSIILHHEGNLNLVKDFKKKFFYGGTAHVFIRRHPIHSLNQANMILRPAFLNNWKKLLANPIMTISMMFMKSIEVVAVFLGVVFASLPVSVIDPWKKND
jgi:arabinofuranan 3-O-arabinosyltransferase